MTAMWKWGLRAVRPLGPKMLVISCLEIAHLIIQSSRTLFALGSTLYELITGKEPYDRLSHESVENLFREGVFPGVDGLPLGDLIMGCWVERFRSAREVLKFGEGAYRL